MGVAMAEVALNESDETNLTDDISSAYDELQSVSPDDSPEASADDSLEPANPAPEPESQGEPEEEIEPHQHWKSEYKEAFKAMPTEAKKAWIEREREYENGFREKAQELSKARNFAQGFVQTVKPLVQGWQMKGVTPAQGLASMVAREQALRENPQQTLLAIAEQYGVNLEQAYQDAPYVDPAVKSMQQKLQEFEQREREREQQQQQHAQQSRLEMRRQAEHALSQFASSKDEQGNLKYPYATNGLFADGMAKYLVQNPGSTLEQAYAQVETALKGHPFIKSQLDSVVKQTASQNQAKVERARSASKTVDGRPSADSQIERSLRDDIALALEERGVA